MTLWVSHGDWRLKRLSFDGSAPLPTGSRVVVTWDDPQQVSGRNFPHRVRMSVDKAGLDVQLRYRDVELNAELGEDAFRVPCPAGTQIMEAPCPNDGLQSAPYSGAPSPGETTSNCGRSREPHDPTRILRPCPPVAPPSAPSPAPTDGAGDDGEQR